MPIHCENLHQGHKVAVLLSCPGRLEQIAGKPAAGQTGVILNAILNRIGLNRSDIAINNTYARVIYKAQDGRTEPNYSEALDPKNIRRLEKDLFPEVKIIIAMGKVAVAAARELQRLHPELVVIDTRHPGFCSLNHIRTDVNGRHISKGSASATARRVDVVAKNILEQVCAKAVNLFSK